MSRPVPAAAGEPAPRVIRLLSVAGSCRSTLAALGCADTRSLIALVQDAVGDRFRVTASARQVEAAENDRRGGRQDDAGRAREIERTFADDRVAAAVALRGGAWLTRILPRIDFNVLNHRRAPLALFGFSELTPLLNIAAACPSVFAYHDLCPAFLLPGMTDYARRHVRSLLGPARDSDEAESFAQSWAKGRFRESFAKFFRDVASIIEGRGSARRVTGRWVRNRPRPTVRRRTVTLVGGNLTTLVTLLTSPYAAALRPDGRWLLLEDIRETPDRVDRLLSHLSLSGWLARYDGIVLGRFRDRSGDITRAVLACLECHLGRARPPIVLVGKVGHVWPIAPLPLGRPFAWRITAATGDRTTVVADIPWPHHRVNR